MTDAQFDRISALLIEIAECLNKLIEMEEQRREDET